MKREEGCEWYQSNHYDFAYNRGCFVAILKGLLSRCKSQKKRLVQKKCGVC
jgi:hypothetical protein